MPGTPDKRRSRAPTWLLALLTLCVPVAILGTAEAVLRAFGYGGHEPLFVTSDAPSGHLGVNPLVATRFVADPSRPPLTAIDRTFFRVVRPEGGLRIVVQGGSSAAGFPYGRWGALAGMLQNRLRLALPDREVEVIGTAMSAVNSYTLLDLADEIVSIAPDAVLIYSGHNEYLGILGVGSTYVLSGSRAIKLAFLRVRDLALFQALQRLRGALRGTATGDEEAAADAPGTLMALVVGERNIPFDSDLYHRGLDQFRSNLSDLLVRYADAGIAVFLATLASNERDHPPFASGLRQETAAADYARRLARAEAAFREGALDEALADVDEALAVDDSSADAHFLRGRILDLRDDGAAAHRAYQSAADRDLLRFRAPKAMNDIVRELAHTFGATLVDVQAAFAEASPRGIIGEELMLEHLHPNAEGYFLLADAFYDALRTSPRVTDFVVDVPDEQARRDSPITEMERAAAAQRVAVLRANWPFVPDATEVAEPKLTPQSRPERIGLRMEQGKISWTAAMDRALVYYEARKNWTEAARVAVNVAETYAHSPAKSAHAGRLLLASGRTDAAVVYLERAVALAPRDAEYREMLSEAHRTASGVGE